MDSAMCMQIAEHIYFAVIESIARKIPQIFTRKGKMSDAV